MEKIAFGEPHDAATISERVVILEEKVFGSAHQGSLVDRVEALRQYMNVPDTPDSPEQSHRTLQANVSMQQLQGSEEDDSRFSGVWIGTLASKIDPRVHVYCELRGAESHFRGVMIWTSNRVGGCRRLIVGKFSPRDNAVVMKDTSVVSLNLDNRYGFCKVTRYTFACDPSGNRLSGWFYSRDCEDEGAVTLDRYSR